MFGFDWEMVCIQSASPLRPYSYSSEQSVHSRHALAYTQPDVSCAYSIINVRSLWHYNRCNTYSRFCSHIVMYWYMCTYLYTSNLSLTYRHNIWLHYTYMSACTRYIGSRCSHFICWRMLCVYNCTLSNQRGHRSEVKLQTVQTHGINAVKQCTCKQFPQPITEQKRELCLWSKYTYVYHS